MRLNPIKTGVHVLPIAHNVWPPHQWLKYPGTITVIIGKPIAPKGRSVAAVTEEASNWIEAELAAIR